MRDDRVVAFGSPDGVRKALAAGKAPGGSQGEWPLADVRLLAPIPRPGTIYAIGLNYAEHIRETGGTPPEQPIVLPNPGDLRLRTWVNGDLRQDSRTSDLIFSCQELVDFISQTCTLQPGDLILTGTPNGVGMTLDPPRFLSSGDRVRIEIGGLGEIQHAGK